MRPAQIISELASALRVLVNLVVISAIFAFAGHWVWPTREAQFREKLSVISAAEFEQVALHRKARVIDARSALAYEEAHVPGAMNMPAERKYTIRELQDKGLPRMLIWHKGDLSEKTAKLVVKPGSAQQFTGFTGIENKPFSVELKETDEKGNYIVKIRPIESPNGCRTMLTPLINGAPPKWAETYVMLISE